MNSSIYCQFTRRQIATVESCIAPAFEGIAADNGPVKGIPSNDALSEASRPRSLPRALQPI